MNINFNPDAHIEITGDWEISFSHGPQANYVIHGEAIQTLVDHIKYLELLIEKCPGEKTQKYLSLLKEFYPYVEIECSQALSMGPPPQEHIDACHNDCPDCQWYNWALSFQQRIKQGEFNEII